MVAVDVISNYQMAQQPNVIRNHSFLAVLNLVIVGQLKNTVIVQIVLIMEMVKNY